MPKAKRVRATPEKATWGRRRRIQWTAGIAAAAAPSGLACDCHGMSTFAPQWGQTTRLPARKPFTFRRFSQAWQ